MKIIHVVLASFICCLFVSCKQADADAVPETDFSFNQEQPLNVSKINRFYNRLIGTYINKDSTYLIVTDKQLVYKYIRKSKLSLQEFKAIEDSSKIVGDKIYLKDNLFYDFRKLKDSIEITSINYDTLFSISENQVAKKIRNTIILNTKDSIYWQIKTMIFEKDKLTFKTLVSCEDLRRIDSLSETKVQKIDSTRNVIQFTKKEFKKMLKLKNLGYNQEFTKLTQLQHKTQ